MRQTAGGRKRKRGSVAKHPGVVAGFNQGNGLDIPSVGVDDDYRKALSAAGIGVLVVVVHGDVYIAIFQVSGLRNTAGIGEFQTAGSHVGGIHVDGVIGGQHLLVGIDADTVGNGCRAEVHSHSKGDGRKFRGRNDRHRKPALVQGIWGGRRNLVGDWRAIQGGGSGYVGHAGRQRVEGYHTSQDDNPIVVDLDSVFDGVVPIDQAVAVVVHHQCGSLFHRGCWKRQNGGA